MRRRYYGNKLDFGGIIGAWMFPFILVLVISIFLFLLYFVLKIILWYAGVIQAITGFENKTAGLFYSMLLPPFVICMTIEKILRKKKVEE